MCNILWVTSFTEKLYNATGKDMLESFLETETEGNMFIGKENMFGYIPHFKNNFIFRDIDNIPLLKNFLEDNKDIIPIHLDGKLLPCLCPDPWAQRDRLHKKNCNHIWFKRNMSLWFRKFVALNEAKIFMADFDYLIWLDCDCVFKQKVTSEFIEEVVFNNNTAGVSYLLGNRNIIEGGFVAYNFSNFFDLTKGQELLSKIILKYISGEFRGYKRWDDCYLLQKISNSMDINVNDLGTYTIGNYNDIFTRSKIGDYIQHNKGTHGRKLGIMK